jgi:valyl-tRNA synthetase
MVPRGDRSGQIIEPFLTDQWFVKMDELGKIGLEAVESGQIEFVPGELDQYLPALDGKPAGLVHLSPAVVGPPHPGLVRRDGNIYVGRSEEEVREKNDLAEDVELSRDEDVLETWFSSALWAHSTLGWPDKKRMQRKASNATCRLRS